MPPRLRLPPLRPQVRFFSTTPTRKTWVLDGTNALIAAHTATGLPWWALIPLTAISVRALVTTPFALYARQRINKITALAPLIRATILATARSSRTPPTRITQLRAMYAMHKRHVGSPLTQYLPLLQIPVWVYASAVVRALTGRPLYEVFGIPEGPAPGIAEEGLAWCADLVAADPTMGLSIAFSGFLLANSEFQRWVDPPRTARQKMLVNGISVLAVAVVPISAGVPSAVVLYWATSAAYSLVQNVIFWRVLGKREVIEGPKKSATNSRDRMEEMMKEVSAMSGVKTLRKRLGEVEARAKK